ncbi:hypothetical protein [Paenibacillus elgii]|uniref:hypothetical protein n=1 Tax=Paenibacillus elgii TaxID=189691 RepID=UPI00203EFD93|nr:hypothetical protein [Paenibacillus elgii]MCM3273898.1 hypothetical protein [Paenibacillus elgii]
MALYEISDSQMNNLLVFLDRVKNYEGIKEVVAMNEIIAVLSNPVKEENKK